MRGQLDLFGAPERTLADADWSDARAEIKKQEQAEHYWRRMAAKDRAERKAGLVMPAPNAVAGVTKARLMARR